MFQFRENCYSTVHPFHCSFCLLSMVFSEAWRWCRRPSLGYSVPATFACSQACLWSPPPSVKETPFYDQLQLTVVLYDCLKYRCDLTDTSRPFDKAIAVAFPSTRFCPGSQDLELLPFYGVGFKYSQEVVGCTQKICATRPICRLIFLDI